MNGNSWATTKSKSPPYSLVDPQPQNVGTCYKMKYININVPPSQDFIEVKELKS